MTIVHQTLPANTATSIAHAFTMYIFLSALTIAMNFDDINAAVFKFCGQLKSILRWVNFLDGGGFIKGFDSFFWRASNIYFSRSIVRVL